MSKLWLQTWAGAGNSLFPAPLAADHASWLDGLHDWRKAARSAAGLDEDHAKIFEIPGLKWTQTSYIQPQVHTFDRMLWNETSASYSVDHYLDDVQQQAFVGIGAGVVFAAEGCVQADLPRLHLQAGLLDRDFQTQ